MIALFWVLVAYLAVSSAWFSVWDFKLVRSRGSREDFSRNLRRRAHALVWPYGLFVLIKESLS